MTKEIDELKTLDDTELSKQEQIRILQEFSGDLDDLHAIIKEWEIHQVNNENK